MFIMQADVVESYVIGIGVLIAGIASIARLERPELIPAKTSPPVEASNEPSS
jgi:hypothetical protein